MSTETHTSTHTITVNDKVIALVMPVSLIQALHLAEQGQGRYVVVLNDTIVPRSEQHRVMVKPGDRLDVIAPMSGG